MLQAPWHTRWQVASPDPSPRNRAQAAFEVHGDCAFFGKCLIYNDNDNDNNNNDNINNY